MQLRSGPLRPHGTGCGLFGSQGNFEGAYALLRNEGLRVDADYVQIMTAVEPYSDGQCAHNEYKLTGVAYKLSNGGAAQPTRGERSQKKDDGPAEPQQRCVPGSTQACLGPGACKGGQACREDGRGFESCDCGGMSSGNANPNSQ